MENQDQSENTETILGLHPFVCWGLVIIFGVVLLFVAWRYWCYVQNPIEKLSPRQLGLPTIFVFSSAVFLFLLISWEKLGLRLKKFDALEFEQIVETHATEHAEDLSDIEDRLTSL
jgi:hypothetical protein